MKCTQVWSRALATCVLALAIGSTDRADDEVGGGAMTAHDGAHELAAVTELLASFDDPIADQMIDLAWRALSADRSGDLETYRALVQTMQALVPQLGVAQQAALRDLSDRLTGGSILKSDADTGNCSAACAATNCRGTCAFQTSCDAGCWFFGLFAYCNCTGGGAVMARANLSGALETPVNPSTARGGSLLSYDPVSGMLTTQAEHQGMAATVAHVHTGAAGVAGPILIGLTPTGPTSWSAVAPLPAGSLGAFLHEGLYVNIHSGTFPGGEIRGQIMVPTNYFCALSPALETPPVPSSASGRARITLNQPAGTLTYEVEAFGMTPTVAHIHTGATGVPGPITFPLTMTGPTSFAGTTPALTNAQMLDLLQERLYVNVHSVAFPGGEIRDQIRPGGINADGRAVGVANGGALSFSLKADPGSAGSLYLMLGSTSGTVPGLPTAAGMLALNPDGYFNFTLTAPNNPPLAGSLGFLTGASTADATFSIPPGLSGSLVGVNAAHAVVAVNLGTLAVTFASAAWTATLL